jgi:altronate hydrolase
MIDNFKNFYISNNLPVYENPSPGNKKGGITTLEEKSLGCVLKGGTSEIVKVTDYCGGGISNGLNLMSAPGNDLISATALAASGAQIVLFSTGRGTPFSTAVPTVKISSNSALFNKKPQWIDFNAGDILTSDKTAEEYGKMLFDYVLKVASGEKVKAEINGMKEIAFFKTSITL